MSLSLVVNTKDLERLNKRMADMADADHEALLDSVGNLLANSARERISDTKITPDGAAWDAWSEGYAKTRNSGQSLLQSEGDLLDSIGHEVTGDSVLIGSNLVYAGVHDLGFAKKNIPARTYLGISVEDEEAIAGEIDVWFEGLLQ